MGDFFLREEFIETGHLFGKLNNVIYDEKAPAFQKRIGKLEKVDSPFLLPIDKYHVEGFLRELGELYEGVSEDESDDVLHFHFFDIFHGFVIRRKGIINGSHMSAVRAERESEVNGRIAIGSPYLEKSLHPSDMDHILQKLSVLIRDVGNGVGEPVFAEFGKKLADVHNRAIKF